jgi:hypothetical protein
MSDNRTTTAAAVSVAGSILWMVPTALLTLERELGVRIPDSDRRMLIWLLLAGFVISPVAKWAMGYFAKDKKKEEDAV